MTYIGDTDSKRVARSIFWTRAIASMHTRGRAIRTALVLAGPDGGDIGTLVSMGVPVSGIVAVDRKKAYAEACRARWPGAQVIHGDVRSAVRGRARVFDAVFLDFCGPLSPELLKIFMQVVDVGAARQSVVGLGTMRGRERSEALAWLTDAERSYEDAVSDGVIPRHVRGRLDEERNGDVRIWAVDRHVSEMALRRGFVMQGEFDVSYRSARPGFKGTDMLYSGFACHRGVARMNAAKAARHLLRLLTPGIEEERRRNLAGEDNTRSLIVDHRVVRDAFRDHVLDWAAAASGLVGTDGCPASSVSALAAMHFNLPEGTVRAWLAVAARDRRTTWGRAKDWAASALSGAFRREAS